MNDPKPRPNHRLYLAALRRMSSAARLARAFELSAFSKRVFVQGLRRRFADLPPQEFHRLLLARLDYLERWARELSVADLWHRMQAEAEPL